MSKESAKKFMEDLSTKPELVKKFSKNLKNDHDDGDGVKYLCDFANKNGYHCSLEEIKIAMKETSKALDDGELSNVAGGKGWGDAGKATSIAVVETILQKLKDNGTVSKDDIKDIVKAGLQSGMEEL